jgi:hypothetical protein
MWTLCRSARGTYIAETGVLESAMRDDFAVHFAPPILLHDILGSRLPTHWRHLAASPTPAADVCPNPAHTYQGLY